MLEIMDKNKIKSKLINVSEQKHPKHKLEQWFIPAVVTFV